MNQVTEILISLVCVTYIWSVLTEMYRSLKQDSFRRDQELVFNKMIDQLQSDLRKAKDESEKKKGP